MKTSLFFLGIMLMLSITNYAQVAVNTDASSPNADAMLDVKSSDKGILIPRLSLTGTANVTPLANHVAGMIVYNTATAGDVTPGFYYNDGAKWVRVGDASSSGDNLGNHTATQTINTDNNWISGDGGAEGIYIADDGHVGIGYNAGPGTAGPRSKLTIGGTGEDGALSVTGGSIGHIAVFRDIDGENLFRMDGSIGNDDYVISIGDMDEVSDYNTLYVGHLYSSFMNGKVGIGTTSPQTLLHLKSSSSEPAIRVTGPTDEGGIIELGDNDESAYLTLSGANGGATHAIGMYAKDALTIGTTSSSAISFFTNGESNVRMYISNQGKVGIGTGSTAPAEKLHVVGHIRMVDGNQAAGKVMVSDANGTGSWQDVSSSGGWSTTGNAGTTSGTNFIGTTDAQNFDIRTNNILRTRITQKGQIETLNTGNSVFIGAGAGNADDLTDNKNVFVGQRAGYQNTTGAYNTATGAYSFYYNTTGHSNTALGTFSLRNNTTGHENTANGKHSLYSNTTGSYNITAGSYSMFHNTTGNFNTGLGRRAMYSNTSGSSNVAVGVSALYHNSTKSNLVAIGDSALFNNGNGAGANEAEFNTAVGSKALYTNTKGNNNTATGYHALYSNTSGGSNVATGNEALRNNTTGYYNAASGYQALYKNTTGRANTASGYQVLYENTTGYYNTASGSMALNANTEGIDNTASGHQVLYKNTTGNYNTAFGSRALYSNTTGYSSVAVGVGALYKNSTKSNLVAIGDSALFNNGNGAGGKEGLYNTAIGSKVLYTNTKGSFNTATGFKSLYSNTKGNSNTANGYNSLYSNTEGHYNTAMGRKALNYNTSGNSNTAMGYTSLYHNTTGDNNTAIGRYAFINGTNYSNSTALGYNAAISASNQIRLGNSSVTSIGGFANWTNVSDGRFKKDVQENVPGLDFILKLRPVTYHLDMDAIAAKLNTPDSLRQRELEAVKGNTLQTGFIAQEVEKSANSLGYVFSGVDAPKSSADYYGLRYAEFVVPLVKGMQEQQKTIEAQQKEIDELKKLVNQLLKK